MQDVFSFPPELQFSNEHTLRFLYRFSHPSSDHTKANFWAGLSWISEKFNLDGVSILYQVVSISKDSIVIVIPPTSIQYML